MDVFFLQAKIRAVLCAFFLFGEGLFGEGLFGEFKSCTVHVEHAYILHIRYFRQRAFWNAVDISGHSSLPPDGALVPSQPGSKEAVTTFEEKLRRVSRRPASPSGSRSSLGKELLPQRMCILHTPGRASSRRSNGVIPTCFHDSRRLHPLVNTSLARSAQYRAATDNLLGQSPRSLGSFQTTFPSIHTHAYAPSPPSPPRNKIFYWLFSTFFTGTHLIFTLGKVQTSSCWLPEIPTSQTHRAF